MPRRLEPFDPLLLSQARLGIISVLVTRREASFSDLKTLLGLTQGNLGAHLQKLEEAGYVAVRKAFVRRRPRTTCTITRRGRSAFLRHVERLAGVLEAGG
ncbi:MAG: winged helix-turn-helix domain-containing protein [Planctomycetota bacterium]